MQKKILAICISLFTFSPLIHAEMTAPVSGIVREFGSGTPLSDATLTILENNQKIPVDRKGHFGPVMWPVGKPITLVAEEIGYRTTQSATVTVPPEGLNTAYNNIVLQVFDVFTFYLFAGIMDKEIDENKCHVGTTVSQFHKTADDLPQGEEHAKVMLIPATTEIPYYLSVFKDGPFKDGANPFPHGLKETSHDGGTVFTNVDPRDEPYTMIAYKPGVSFREVHFICRKGVFVNLSPPQGPSALS
jgi:hypothetical protein